MDNLSRRIAYYTRKVAEKMTIHPTQKPPGSHTYRYERLMTYKKELNKRIEKQKEISQIL